MDDLQIQRQLNDRDFAIFQEELKRQRKSTGVAYLLWFLLGGLGAHRFYIGDIFIGLIYLVLSVVGWMLIFSGAMSMVGADGESTGILLLAGWGAVAILGLLLLFDLFLIPSYIRNREHNLKVDLIRRFQH